MRSYLNPADLKDSNKWLVIHQKIDYYLSIPNYLSVHYFKWRKIKL
jgi:hypothetical protein